ncbi:MAG: SUMF1/EgtB/PvdO family nonheme iron enzyme [Phycisphaerales bacterium]
MSGRAGGILMVTLAGLAQTTSPFTRAARADIDPVSGIDFVRIGAVGNAPWMGTTPPTAGDRAVGRGSVGYEYHIGRFEWTTAQAVEFFNAAFDRPANDQLPHLIPPRFWGGVSATPTVPGGQRWRVQAGGAMLPVGDISWRMAAMYCNWLHNGKATHREAFLDGAYDVSTFTYTGTVFNDQQRHHPDARYWIPTWDEWLKAAHYDPAKDNGDGTTGGWWIYPNGGDTPLVYGPPGAMVNGAPTQANGPWSQSFPGANPFGVLLGAYTNAPSPWGLFDVAGATSEWTEEVSLTNGLFPTDRYFDGTAWLDSQGNRGVDRLQSVGGIFPSFSNYNHGFRIASSVPGPSCSVLLALSAVMAWKRPRGKRGSHERKSSYDDRRSCPDPVRVSGAEHPLRVRRRPARVCCERPGLHHQRRRG